MKIGESTNIQARNHRGDNWNTHLKIGKITLPITQLK